MIASASLVSCKNVEFDARVVRECKSVSAAITQLFFRRVHDNNGHVREYRVT